MLLTFFQNIVIFILGEVFSGRIFKGVTVMKECKIRLNSINDVKEFVAIVCEYTFEVDLLSGRYAVDAKSIMGIFSLDLGKTLDMKVHSDGEDAENFLDDVKKFTV